MGDKKDRGRTALDVGSTLVTAAGTLVDMGATGGAIAGGKLLWDAVTAGIGRRERRKAEACLNRLAEALGEEKTAELAVELDEAGENEVWDTVEKGFRAMMGAINETAKRCIAVLVADYIVRQELPDREFRLHGKLLADCDDPMLRCLWVISGQFAQVYDQPHGGPRDPRGYSYTLLTGEVSGVREIFFHRNHASGKAEIRLESKGEPCPEKLEVVTRALEQNEFGLPQTSSRYSIGPDSTLKARTDYQALFIVHDGVSFRLRRLYDYLNPVFFEPSLSRRDDVTTM